MLAQSRVQDAPPLTPRLCPGSVREQPWQKRARLGVQGNFSVLTKWGCCDEPDNDDKESELAVPILLLPGTANLAHSHCYLGSHEKGKAAGGPSHCVQQTRE